jgi:N-acetylmuramoyl-L-alanine amidase
VTQRIYKLGDTGPAVAEIRQRLALLGLLQDAVAATDGSPDGAFADAVYDEAVDVAVRTFQQQRSITVDGIVGHLTYRILEEARWRLGDRILLHHASHPMAGDDVAQLQHRLMQMGFDSGRVDGIFGTRTEAALREFQRNVGLPPDGTCGPATFKALDRLARTVVGGRPHALRAEHDLERSGPSLSGKVVVIDPGHGGTDRGVEAYGLDEAGVVADLAARIEGRLAATGVYVFLTRGVDGSVLTEADRAAFANQAQAQLCLSLHVDGSDNPSANGVATYYYGNDQYGHVSHTGHRFADLIQREIVARTDLANCRTHGRTLDLLRLTGMPAVRLELGYLTNPGDAHRLAEPGFRDVVAEAIVAAIQRLFLPPDDDFPTGQYRISEFVDA